MKERVLVTNRETGTLRPADQHQDQDSLSSGNTGFETSSITAA